MRNSSYERCHFGGGLAGGCVARQLSLEAPHLSCTGGRKAPASGARSGAQGRRISVEIGAHYFRAGARSRVASASRPARETRACAISSRRRQSRSDAALRARAAEFPPVPSFQLDRGRLENYLLREERERHRGARRLQRPRHHARRRPHRISVATPDGNADVEARWLVDASGRAGLLTAARSRAAEYATSPTPVGSACARASGSTSGQRRRAWQARVPIDQRWLSTTHLMGRATGCG